MHRECHVAEIDTGGYRKLSVIVPVFNERNTVVEIVRRMRAVELPVEKEIVIVDDGSDDGTRAVLTQLGDSTVRVVLHPQNRGKGSAIRTGLEHVTGDLVIVQDADLEYDPDDWPKLTHMPSGLRQSSEAGNLSLPIES